MSDPTDNQPSRRSTRSRATSRQEAPASTDAGTTSPAPKSAASGSEGRSQASSTSTAQLGGAVSDAMSQVRSRLQLGEQLLLIGAGLVLLVFVIFQVLLADIVLNDMTVVTAVLAIAAVWVHRWGHHDFGNGYRLIVGALGLALAIFAIVNFLTFLRLGAGADGGGALLAHIVLWAGGLIAGYGAWVVWRTGR
jgi:hypothetical protein